MFLLGWQTQKDDSSKAARAVITIEVTDINDAAPDLIGRTHFNLAAVNNSANATIGSIMIQDRDTPVVNRRLNAYLTNEQEYFRLVFLPETNISPSKSMRGWMTLYLRRRVQPLDYQLKVKICDVKICKIRHVIVSVQPRDGTNRPRTVPRYRGNGGSGSGGGRGRGVGGSGGGGEESSWSGSFGGSEAIGGSFPVEPRKSSNQKSNKAVFVLMALAGGAAIVGIFLLFATLFYRRWKRRDHLGSSDHVTSNGSCGGSTLASTSTTNGAEKHPVKISNSATTINNGHGHCLNDNVNNNSSNGVIGSNGGMNIVCNPASGHLHQIQSQVSSALTTPCGGDYISVGGGGRGGGGGGGGGDSLEEHQYGGVGGIEGRVGVRSGQSSPGDVRDGVSEIGAAEMRNCQQQTDISLKSNHLYNPKTPSEMSMRLQSPIVMISQTSSPDVLPPLSQHESFNEDSSSAPGLGVNGFPPIPASVGSSVNGFFGALSSTLKRGAGFGGAGIGGAGFGGAASDWTGFRAERVVILDNNNVANANAARYSSCETQTIT